MTLRVGPTECPICGILNRCGVEAGKSACWCHSVEVSTKLIDSLPEELKDLSCLCQSCASKDGITPCIGECVLDPATQCCTGCARSSTEIAQWSQLSVEQKIAVMRRLNSPD